MVAVGLRSTASKSASVRRKDRLDEVDGRGGLGEGARGGIGRPVMPVTPSRGQGCVGMTGSYATDGCSDYGIIEGSDEESKRQ